jgi:hypothetical protein
MKPSHRLPVLVRASLAAMIVAGAWLAPRQVVSAGPAPDAASASTAYAAAVLGSVPDLYYRFVQNEAGPAIGDFSGHSNNGALHGAASLGRTGIFGDGGDGAVGLSGGGSVWAPSLSATQGNQPRTVELWFRAGQTGSTNLFTTGSTGRAHAMDVALVGPAGPGGGGSIAAEGLYVRFWDSDIHVAHQVLTDDAWHYVAVAVAGASVNIVLDGKQPSGYVWNGSSYTASPQPQPFSLAYAPNTSPAASRFGDAGWASGFTGDLAELTVYPRALSPAELAAHYAAAGAGVTTSDQGVADDAHDMGGLRLGNVHSADPNGTIGDDEAAGRARDLIAQLPDGMDAVQTALDNTYPDDEQAIAVQFVKELGDQQVQTLKSTAAGRDLLFRLFLDASADSGASSDKTTAQQLERLLFASFPEFQRLSNEPWLADPSLLAAADQAGTGFQRLRDGNGPYKFDDYFIDLQRMPTGLTPQAYLSELAQDPNKAVNNQQFTDLSNFHKRNPSDNARIGSIYDIDVGATRLSPVMLVELSSQHFVFQTLRDHVEYGAPRVRLRAAVGRQHPVFYTRDFQDSEPARWRGRARQRAAGAGLDPADLRDLRRAQPPRRRVQPRRGCPALGAGLDAALTFLSGQLQGAFAGAAGRSQVSR